METNDNKGQLKKLGKIEGVIYVESDNGSAPVNNQQGDVPLPDAGLPKKEPTKKEPTKGVQTYIPMSQYIRLNNIRAVRGETIGNLVAQSIALWLDVQEGKKSINTNQQ
jgi:hypothetical protein